MVSLMNDLLDISLYTLNALSLQTLLVTLGCFSLGIFVLFREPGSRLGAAFALLNFAFAVWICGSTLMYAAPSEQVAIYWAKFAHIGIVFIPAAAYTYSAVLLRDLDKLKWNLLAAWTVSAIFLLFIIATDTLFGKLYHYSWGFYPKYNVTGIPFIICFFAAIINSLRCIINGYCEGIQDPIQLNRAKLILVPFFLAIIACVDFIPAFGVPLYPFGYIPIALYVFFALRSVLTYRMITVGPAFAATQIIDTMNEALIVFDGDGIIKFVNQATCTLLGYNKQEIVNKTPNQGMVDNIAFAGMLETIFKGEVVRNLGLECRSRNGRIHTLNLSTTIMKDQGDNLLAVVCVMADVTERKRAEEALRKAHDELETRVRERTMELTELNDLLLFEVKERAAVEEELYRSRQMLQLVMDNIPQRVFWKDLDFRYMGCNRPFAENAGLENPAESIGRDDFQMPWFEDAVRYREIDRQVIEKNSPELNYEEQQLQPDGTVSWLIRNKVPLHDRDGNVIGVLGTIQNITESMRIKETLRFTQFSVDQAVFPIFWLDEEGRFSYMNEACRYLGYSTEELGAMTIFDITPELSRENWSAWWREIIDKGFNTFEGLHKTKEGSLVPVELTVHPVEHSGRVFHLSYVRDISERKKAEERIRNQLERLGALRAIDEAISASLDLKVTLNVVLDQIIAQLDADAADILLLNDSYKLRHAASRGFRTNALRHTSLAIGQGNAGRVAMEMRIVHVPDVRSGENPFKSAPLLYDEGFISYYGLPLVAKGQTVGVLEIFFRSTQKLEQERLDFLETMAGHAAIAIDNATLFTGLQKSNLELTLAYDSTLEGWSRALDLRDRETEGHSQRVTDMTEHLAKTMDVPESEIMHMRRGAILHDIGKMGIPDHILLKSGPLDEQEMAIMQCHPVYAFEFLSPIIFLLPALEIPYCHHEKWDGSGYPRGLKGKQIPLSARIFAIVDVWDALRSDRPYRAAWSYEKTRDHILGLAGTHFDPRVVEVFKSYHTELQ